MKGHYREITEAEMEENRRIFWEDNSEDGDDEDDEEKVKPKNRRQQNVFSIYKVFFEENQGQYIKMAEIKDYLCQNEYGTGNRV